MEHQLVNANRKFAEMTSSRTNMSSRMVSSEQEKLKVGECGSIQSTGGKRFYYFRI